MNYKDIIDKQRKYFQNGNTLCLNKRIDILKQIKKELLNRYDDIVDAFKKDFNKCEFDVISTEISMILFEINYLIKNIKKYHRKKKVRSNLINFPSKNYIYKKPYGVTLIISPWNYPLQLAILPLVDAIAGGNTVILKPSEYSLNVSNVIKDIFSKFDENLITVILGDKDVSSALLLEKFDLIFYTGSTSVGRIVMEKASKHLTPVVLELGGKSPCIITKDADLEIAAKRVVWGKFLNAGQTCVAPDFVLIEESIKEKFIKKAINKIKEFYYDNDQLSSEFTSIINELHVKRLINLIDKEKIAFGGKIINNTIEPTIMDNVEFSDPVMQEEIFGPIMPIISYKELDSVIDILKTKEKPLALYIFSNNKKDIEKVLSNLSFGGGCINDVIMHLTNESLPFGGVGSSGMGRYHGNYSLDTFTKELPIFKKGKLELNVKYPKYTNKKLNLLKRILKIKNNKQ